MNRKSPRTLLLSLAFTVAPLFLFVVICEFAIRTLFGDSTVILPPSRIAHSATTAFNNGLLLAVRQTLVHTLVGFAIATCIGIFGGVLLARIPLVRTFLLPCADLLRGMPSSLIVPVLLVLPMFAFSERTYIATVVFGSVWPILYDTFNGVESIHRTAWDTIKQFRISRLRRVFVFTLPAASTAIFTGMRVGLAVAFILSITAEILGGQGVGIGAFVEKEAQAGAYGTAYFGMFVVAIVGFGLNRLFGLGERVLPCLKYRYAD